MLIPVWLEAKRVPDAAIASAYENTSPGIRAALKTGIALSHFLNGDNDDEKTERRISRRLGIASRIHSQPADWAALFISSSIKAAAPVEALAILPVLAGVKTILAITVEKPTREALLSLMLCGIENIFSASCEECEKLAEYGRNHFCGKERMVCLHKDGSPAFLAKWPAIQNLECSPAVLVDNSSGNWDLDIIRFCQGANFETEDQKGISWDAIFTDKKSDQTDARARLILGPGCEGFWQFPQLGIEYFRQERLCVELPGDQP